MGLNDAKALILKHLAAGSIQHEARAMIHEKNLLQVGDVTPDQVAKLINATKGAQYKSMPHQDAPTVEMHVFEPETALKFGEEKCYWHIKCYVVEPNAIFISVHRSHVKKSSSKKVVRRKRK